MAAFSLNTKLLAIVTAAVAVAAISISTISGLRQLTEKTEASELRIASLIAVADGGNVKFAKTDSLTEEFASYAADESFFFNYGAAVKSDGSIVAELHVTNTLSSIGIEMGKPLLTPPVSSLRILEIHSLLPYRCDLAKTILLLAPLLWVGTKPPQSKARSTQLCRVRSSH